MFTTNASVADYVYLLTRTNPDVPKHRGLTVFLVPFDTPGVEVQAVHTMSGERTNITYYSDEDFKAELAKRAATTSTATTGLQER